MASNEHYLRIRRGGNRAAVCFVHGILGHYRETWGEFPFLFLQDSRLVHCDVICWGYPSDLGVRRMFRFPRLGRRLPDIENVAKSLHTDLCNPEIGGEYHDLVLVGHSMGGLVIMKALLNALSQTEPDMRVASRLRHVVLYGTPTDGVQLPAVFRAHAQARGLACGAAEVSKIRDLWINRVYGVRKEDEPEKGKLYVATTTVVGLEDNAVTPASAAGYFDAETVQGDHVTMVKPDDRSHSSFQLLRTIVLGSTLPRLLRGGQEVIEANRRVVGEAEHVIFTTGSRSRDLEYLAAIEHKLQCQPALRYYRVLMGPPLREEMIDHLERVLQIRDPSSRAEGHKTTHLAEFDALDRQPEVFLCGNEHTVVVVLPPLTGLGRYSAALIVTGLEYVNAYKDLVHELYSAGTPLEDAEAVASVRERWTAKRLPE